MGAADAKSTKNDYQFYRLIMPAFLHAHFEHIFGNVLFQLYLGSGIEHGIGFFWMAFLYIVTEIGGVLLAITFHPEAYGVGASCAGYGLVGFGIAYLFTNWGFMGRTKEWQRIYLLSFCFLFFAMNQGLSVNWESHNIGHQGGLITGILCGLTITEQYDYNATSAGRSPDRYTEEDWKDRSCFRNVLCNRCGLIFLILWFILLFVLFYTWTDVDIEQN
mgnify:CR=1 FL=1